MNTRLIVVVGLLLLACPPAGAANGDLLQRGSVAIDPEKLLADLPAERAERLRPSLAAIRGEIRVQRIVYESDRLKVRGYLVTPHGPEKLPCVIFNRGGNREFGALTDLRAVLLLGRLARRGYVVVAGQYRGNGGGEGQEEFGGADVNDVLNLIPLLEGLPRADASRIGMYGWSRGGMMTYLALTRTDRIKAAVVGGGMTDSFASIEARPEMEGVYEELVPDWKERREAALAARSAVRWPEKLHKQTPILLMHGTADWRVAPTQAIRMAEALLEVRHPFRLILFEGGDHGLSEYREQVAEEAGGWFDRYVRDGASWPSLEPHGR